MSTGTDEAESVRTGSDPNNSDDAARSPETALYRVGRQTRLPSSGHLISTTKNGHHGKLPEAPILTLTGGGRPEDFSYRGVDLLTACVSGDLPLVSMLLGEGAQSGVDMLAADAVRVADVSELRNARTEFWKYLKVSESQLSDFAPSCPSSTRCA